MLKETEEKSPQNYFIRRLRDRACAQFDSHLELIEMPLEMKIYNPNEEISHIYFPETSIISIVTLLENGSGVETSIVGYEGFSGIETILMESAVPREAMVQLGGYGYRMKVEKFRTLFAEDTDFAQQVLHYLYSLITQIAQNSACLCYHPIEKRLARWLLMFHERAATDELKLTQEFIAMMLGVHRQNLNKSLSKLQQEKLISYNRGNIKIADREGLISVSCECYEVIRTAFDGYLDRSEKSFKK